MVAQQGREDNCQHNHLLQDSEKLILSTVLYSVQHYTWAYCGGEGCHVTQTQHLTEATLRTQTGPGYPDFIKAFTNTQVQEYISANYRKNYGTNNIVTAKQ